jgi:hypothetical protein
MIRILIVVAAVGFSVTLLALNASAWLGGRPTGLDAAAAQPIAYADFQPRRDGDDVAATVIEGSAMDGAGRPVVAANEASALPLGGVADTLPLALALGLAATALAVAAAILASFRHAPARKDRRSALA